MPERKFRNGREHQVLLLATCLNFDSKEQSMLDMKLQETGEREKLKEYITAQLNESGWREECISPVFFH